MSAVRRLSFAAWRLQTHCSGSAASVLVASKQRVRFSYTGSHESSSSGGCTSGTSKERDEDDISQLNIAPPMRGLSEADQDRQRKTLQFLRLVMSSAREQDAIDMVQAALNLATLRQHHIDAIVRMARDDREAVEAPRRFVSGGGAAGKVDGLLRATAILKHVTDASTGIRSDPGDAVGLNGEAECASAKDSLVTEDHWNRLLSQLLLPLQVDDAATSSPSGREGSVLTANAACLVWDIAAFMEIHGFRINRDQVVDKMEMIIDAAAHSSVSASPSSQKVQEIRHNRIEFLQAQRAACRQKTAVRSRCAPRPHAELAPAHSNDE